MPATSQTLTRRVPRGLAHAVCSQVDPFCEHARGAKLYDRDSSRSFTYQSRTIFSVPTDANGKLAFQVYPCLSTLYRTAATFTGDAVATWSSYFPDPAYPTLSNIISGWRLVSFGVRVYTSVAPVSAQGHYVAGTVVSDLTDGHDMFAFNTLNMMQETIDGPAAGMQLYWISVPAANEAYQYKEQTASATNTDLGRTMLNFAINGGPASLSMCTVEVVANYELTPQLGDVISAIASTAAPHNPVIEAASSNVLSSIGSFFSGALSDVSSAVASAARSRLAQGAANVALGFLPGGQAARSAAGLIMDVD